MATLLEKYADKIAKAEAIANKAGNPMDNTKKIVLAQCLHNVNSFLNEAFDNSIGTNRSDMGLFKKFSVNLTNIVLPTLIGPDLVMTVPMQSASGYVTYLK